MDAAALRAFVLEKLGRWKRLALSDVETMLPPVNRARLKLELLEALEHEGRISLRYVGDELVLALVESGAPASRTAPSDEGTA